MREIIVGFTRDGVSADVAEGFLIRVPLCAKNFDIIHFLTLLFVIAKRSAINAHCQKSARIYPNLRAVSSAPFQLPCFLCSLSQHPIQFAPTPLGGTLVSGDERLWRLRSSFMPYLGRLT